MVIIYGDHLYCFEVVLVLLMEEILHKYGKHPIIFPLLSFTWSYTPQLVVWDSVHQQYVPGPIYIGKKHTLVFQNPRRVCASKHLYTHKV